MSRQALSDIPAGKIAAVVTSLEMFARPPPRAEPAGAELQLRRVDRADLDWYRDLFRRVGQDWLWFSRLRLSNDALAAILHHPAIELHVLTAGAGDDGVLELDFRQAETCELSFFGVVPKLIGTGAGRFLMNRALGLAWSRPIRRFWVHTCTHDHPDALAFYIRSGFAPFRRHVEIADDPRLDGTLPRHAAPQVPIV